MPSQSGNNKIANSEQVLTVRKEADNERSEKLRCGLMEKVENNLEKLADPVLVLVDLVSISY